MPTYLALVEVESPEPLLVKVRAASFNDAEFRVMHALDIPSKHQLLGVWDLDQVEDVARFLPKRIPRRRPNDVHVRTHMRRT